MNLEIQYFKRAVLVTVDGRIDLPNALELEEALCGLVREGHSNVVIDLSEIDFMGSSALRAMVAGLKECRRKGGDFRIANPSQRVKHVFSLAGLDPIFEVYDELTSAVASF